MAALTADVTKGDLTGGGTKDTIATASSGSNQETWSIIFRNRNGSSRTVTLYLNGTTSTDVFGSFTLDASGGFAQVNITVGPSDVLYAEASAGTSVAWFCSKGILS